MGGSSQTPQPASWSVAIPKTDLYYLDGAAATENMLLALHALGLASCWVQAYDKEYNQAIKELLGIPDRMVLVALVPVAHAEGEVKTPRKRPLDEVLHWEEY